MPDTPPLPSLDQFKAVCAEMFSNRNMAQQVELLNECRRILHTHSPFQAEPVDLVQWVAIGEVTANDYNPNAVAPPEMQLLELSIAEDGYTQPIVGWDTGDGIEVIDGFHRHRVGRESEIVQARIQGFLPLVVANTDRTDRGDRIAATIRHNRARGKHQIGAMSEIVLELKRRNWSDNRISKHLGMDPDEVLRLSQITGLAEVFADTEFAEAWEHWGGPAAEQPAEDGETDDLTWMNDLIVPIETEGWEDRTEQNSVFSGGGRRLGMVQRSRFKDEWFWYAYTAPPDSGRAPTVTDARREVESRT